MSTPSQVAQTSDNQASLHTPKPLNQPFARVTLDVNGNGSVTLGPQRVREHWQPTSASVSTFPNPATPAPNTGTNEAQCSVYMGTTANNTTFLGQTATGSTGDTCGFAGQDMQTGMVITAIWKGGDPGSVATVVVNGTYSIGAPS